MNTQLTIDRRHEHPPQTGERIQVRRVGLLDRAALHLGLALITWGRRPGAMRSERRVTARELRLLQLERERASARHDAGRDATALYLR